MSDVLNQTQQILKRISSISNTIKPVSVERSSLPSIQDNLPDVEGSTFLPTDLWEPLAYDLALDNVPPTQIAQAYSLSLDQLERLQSSPYFSKMLGAKKEEVSSLGADAAFIVKMRMMATRASPQFMCRLVDPATNNKDFHALFKTAVELANLAPKEDISDKQTIVGASVTFNIQGVPGLGHLSSRSTDITDTDYIEIASE